jgi:hypothetical protein
MTETPGGAGSPPSPSRVAEPSGLSADPFTSPDSTNFGGQKEMGSGPITIRCLPYGPLDLGTCLSIVMTDRPLQGSRAGVGPNGAAETRRYSSYDAVAVYTQAGDVPPRFVAASDVADAGGHTHAVTYDATHAFFNPPLPAQWVALLRPNMHVMTNSVDDVKRVQSGRLPINTFAGQVTGGPGVGWDPSGHWIAVDGWAVPGGNTAPGTVPGDNLDTVRSHHAAKALLVGVYTKAFARNTVCRTDPNDPPSAGPGAMFNPRGTIDSQVRECEAEEVDLVNDATTDYTESFHGLTIGYNAVGRVGADKHPVLPTTDSWMINIEGGHTMPQLLRLNGAQPGGCMICGDQFLVNGGQSPARATGSTSVLSDIQGHVDNHSMHAILFAERDSATEGPAAASLHLGMRIDSTIGKFDGARMGGIVWNPPGNYGGMGLETSDGTLGAAVDPHGNLVVEKGLEVTDGQPVCFSGTAFCVRHEAATGKLVVTDSSGIRIVSIDSRGNAVFKGTVTQNATP